MAFRWIGKSTNHIVVGKYIVNSWKELYYILLDKDIIFHYDGYPDDKYIIEKAGLDFEETERKIVELMDNEGYKDYYSALESFVDLPELTEDDYQELVLNSNSEAYYQDWEEV